MCFDTLKLVEPALELKEEFLAMAREHLETGESPQVWDFEIALEDFGSYVKKRLGYAKGENLPKGWVPSSDYWLIADDHTAIGCGSLRHRLTPALRRFGGHTGYYIRPSMRGRGYGTKILSLTIEKAKKLGLKKVLITCDDNNQASIRIIENCGGVLEDKVMNNGRDVLTRRYWIKIG